MMDNERYEGDLVECIRHMLATGQINAVRAAELVQEVA